MNLEEQILSLIFSFSYGIIISYIFNLTYNFINYHDLKYKILINILLFINIFLIYFIFLKEINNGVMHIYFFFILILGFYLFYNKSIFLRKKIKVNVKKSKTKQK